MTSPPARSWQVLLLGGASGTGKTAVSYRLARHFAVGITEVDDFQVLLERMTTQEQQPAIHWWRTHPAFNRLSVQAIMEQGLDLGRAMTPGLEAVIANHLETQTPVLLEGDFIQPSLAAQTSFAGQPNDGRVRAVFLYEADEQQLAENFAQREPERGEQTKRAQVSRLYGEWLEREANRHGLPVVAARPWDTVFEGSSRPSPSRQALVGTAFARVGNAPALCCAASVRSTGRHR